MSDIEHATLTGAFIHEPKGADTAVANRVYVADGVGSGSWTTLGTSSLSTAVFPALLHVQDQKASGTTGGTFTNGAWRTRTINTTVTNDISGASIASNQITLPAGTYWIEAAGTARMCDHHTLKIANITDGTDQLIGLKAHAQDSIGNDQTFIETMATVRGKMVLSGIKVLEVRHRCTTTGFYGDQATFGVVEVYLDVAIWKLP